VALHAVFEGHVRTRAPLEALWNVLLDPRAHVGLSPTIDAFFRPSNGAPEGAPQEIVLVYEKRGVPSLGPRLVARPTRMSRIEFWRTLPEPALQSAFEISTGRGGLTLTRTLYAGDSYRSHATVAEVDRRIERQLQHLAWIAEGQAQFPESGLLAAVRGRTDPLLAEWVPVYQTHTRTVAGELEGVWDAMDVTPVPRYHYFAVPTCPVGLDEWSCLIPGRNPHGLLIHTVVVDRARRVLLHVPHVNWWLDWQFGPGPTSGTTTMTIVSRLPLLLRTRQAAPSDIYEKLPRLLLDAVEPQPSPADASPAG
jgi:hypothetical protein